MTQVPQCFVSWCHHQIIKIFNVINSSPAQTLATPF